MKPWLLGNTTVRSPFRLREGLVALSTSALQGHLRGREQEVALRQHLGAHGIVALGTDDSHSVGRKWRSALNKLGFLYPEVPAGTGVAQSEIGQLDTITPNGWRLIRAETVPAMQECFLRALAAHYIPSALERGFEFSVFSPLRHTLAIMLELERLTGASRLDFIEMALVVQLSNGDEALAHIVARILDLRARRAAAANKRLFDRQERVEAARLHHYAANTFNDYGDTNFRYFKATGLVQSQGRGISLVPEKHLFIERLVADTAVPQSGRAYFSTLCNGAALPTDDQQSALAVLADLRRQAGRRGIAFDLGDRPTGTSADIAIIRHEIEALLAEANEITYASRQVHVWEEILATWTSSSPAAAEADLPPARKLKCPGVKRQLISNG